MRRATDVINWLGLGGAKKRGKDWSRESLPLLSVRIRTRVSSSGRKRRFRMIKVREDGPKAGRWVNFANWWWRNNRGPIPPGKRVAHLDGDSLNDDPDNLALLSPADVVYLCHDRDPAMSERNFAKLREATRRFNVEYAAARRAREWLPSKWYPVDRSARVIYNHPRRKRWQVYADLGLDTGPNHRAAPDGRWASVRGSTLREDPQYRAFGRSDDPVPRDAVDHAVRGAGRNGLVDATLNRGSCCDPWIQRERPSAAGAATRAPGGPGRFSPFVAGSVGAGS